MKNKFTVVKAASVMLVSFGLGTSCQKEAVAPAEPMAVTSKTAANASASMDGVTKYAVTNEKGDNVGVIVLYSNEKNAALEVDINNDIARSANGLSAWLISKNGERAARLSDFVDMRGEEGQSITGSSEKGIFSSFTSPVVNIKSGDKFTVDDLQNAGYEIIIVNREGYRIASGMLQ
jgi:hypothetical protein